MVIHTFVFQSYIPDAGALLTFGWGLYGQVSFCSSKPFLGLPLCLMVSLLENIIVNISVFIWKGADLG